MSCSVGTHAHSPVACRNFYIGLIISDRDPNRLIRKTGREDRKSSCKRNETVYRHSGGGADHVRFLDPHLKEPFGKSVLKCGHLYRIRQIGGQNNDLFIFRPKIDKGFTKSFSHCLVTSVHQAVSPAFHASGNGKS